MPEVEIEIMRTVTITREESAVVQLNVPKRVLNDDEVLDWVDDVMRKGTEGSSNKAVYEAVNGAEWDVNDEDKTVEYNDAYAID